MGSIPRYAVEPRVALRLLRRARPQRETLLATRRVRKRHNWRVATQTFARAGTRTVSNKRVGTAGCLKSRESIAVTEVASPGSRPNDADSMRLDSPRAEESDGQFGAGDRFGASRGRAG